ncbi:neutral/alkaline non-lysosomal ceramidase N-terminal domain-containing protein [Aurantibacter sp.]|uniref:neutral/alkaline non-lysosomal ceramidase N-terminal domain-containing protein n=1 Tax=Aurantibacter sp. TaxID=2807103 RepID=UPI003266B110
MKTKKWQRRLLRVLGICAFILLLLFYVLTDPITTDPYFESNYYKNTVAKMDTAFLKKVDVNGKLLAGFARMNISPKIVADSPDTAKGEFSAIKMAGYGDGQFATGVHDSLFAKAIVLEVNGKELVFLSADMVVIPELVVQKVAENLEGIISREHILFGATHTHASIGNCIPKFVGESFGGEYQPEVVAWLGKKFTQLILNAKKDKKESKFSSGFIHVPNLIRNRIIGETGRLNDKLNLVSFSQNEGRKAVIGIFGAHATTIATWNDKLSGDYPGYFQRSLETKGVDLALFFAGTVGSHSNKGKGEKYEKTKYIGETLADSAAVVINKMEYDSVVKMTAITTEIEIPELQAFYISDRRRVAPWVAEKLMADMQTIYLQGVRLNDLVWLAMPYELSGEYGIDLKNALEVAGYNSSLTSFNGQYLGYIVPQKYYYFETYEAQLMGWYGPSMGDYLMELNFKLANELTDKRL